MVTSNKPSCKRYCHQKQYVLRPPAGCPNTPLRTYWLLKRTLCGLKRSPKHCFDRATNLLTSIGLRPCPNAPSLFHGVLIPSRPPLYLGLYVNDFVYFSKDPDVERHFEDEFGKLTAVDFMGQVTFFLGIKFSWRVSPTKVSVHLSQQAFVESLLEQFGFSPHSTSSKPTPYRSGHPVDAILDADISISQR